MPERVMVYDACEYEYQMKEIHKKHMNEDDYDSYREKKSRMKERDFLLPIITAVLYLGEGRWESRHRLTEMFRTSSKGVKLREEYLNDYSFPLIEADFVNAEKYRTDLREFFYAMQCRQDKKQLAELFQTERFQSLSVETVQEIAVHLPMKGLVEKIENSKEERVSMCKAVDDWLAEERDKGRRAEKLQIIKRMQEAGIEESLILQITKCTKVEFATAVGE